MATLYAKTAGGNWSSANTWSTTSSAGADNSGPPLATTDVIFDSGATGAVVVDTTTCVAKSLTCQSASNVLTFGAGNILTMAGNVTFFTGMGANLSGTGQMVMNANATITSNGVAFPGAFANAGPSRLITLSGDFTVNGLVTIAAVSLRFTGSQLICAGGLLASASTGNSASNIVITGGTWSGSGTIAHNLIINPATAVTISGAVTFQNYSTNALTYTAGAGTVSASGSTLTAGGGVTMNTGAMVWGNVIFTGASNTLSSVFNCSGSLSFGANPNTYSLTGAFNTSCGTLQLISQQTLALTSGTTLSITSGMSIVGTTAYPSGIQPISGTISVNYSGTAANCQISGALLIFTNTGNALDNWYGNPASTAGTIRTSADIGVHNVFSAIP